MQNEEDMQVTISKSDLIYSQVKDLGKRMDRLENRMDKLEEKLEKLSERLDRQDAKIEKLADKIDALRTEIKGTSGNISISNITTIGIALGVLYFVATH